MTPTNGSEFADRSPGLGAIVRRGETECKRLGDSRKLAYPSAAPARCNHLRRRAAGREFHPRIRISDSDDPPSQSPASEWGYTSFPSHLPLLGGGLGWGRSPASYL